MNEELDTVAKTLREVQVAVGKLEGVETKRRSARVLVAAAIVAVFVLAGAAVVVLTFFESGGLHADETTALLLAVLLFTPFIHQLKILEFGGAKAEFAVPAAETLRGLVEALTKVDGAVTRLVQEKTLNAAGQEGEDEATCVVRSSGVPAADGPSLAQVLWLDAGPKAPAYERDAVARLFTVVAEDDKRVARQLWRSGAFDAVVIAGTAPAVVKEFAELNPRGEVILYAPPDAVVEQDQLGKATIATSTDRLVKILRRVAGKRFDQEVRARVADEGAQMVDDRPDVDYLADFGDGHRIALETAHWLRQPTAAALQARIDKLAKAVETGEAAEAYLVTPKPVTKSKLEAITNPAEVAVLTFDELQRANLSASQANESG
ncbi:hypothetical protein M8542_12845 [Amycolatopsis sp. OK19-0408]|uniref:Uncharacterized protein n=1 Tax=Amycolatopsis iheyensis TaxID=2945988 RepID=A0A9X2NFL3_9PSEU|nr:hypothetical protein [Amycolatopsis iheyensis]MCR6483705.1 hypothetical protein [Amycolatopsis iheyensis]